MDEATREIMWNIPASFKYTMYFLFAISMVIFVKGFYNHFAFIKTNTSFSWPKITNLNWRNFFKTIFLQGKVPRDRGVGAFHALIFYGFLILWIATDLVAIHYDTPFKVFQGTTYIVISFLADIGGFALLIGLGLGYYRRYVKKPDYLSATHPKQELYMYGMLANLVVIGFIIEAVRLLGTDAATGAMEREKTWAPIGWALAVCFQKLNLSGEGLSIFYRGLWFFHMVSTMVFIGSIPFSKFSHFIYAPLSALFVKKGQAAIIGAMDFENEDAETFGLGKTNELSFKQKFDTQACVECGRCTQFCPANQAGKILDPKLIITKMRDYLEDPKTKNPHESNIWGEDPENGSIEALYKANELDACTTCGSCMEECPMNIEHVPLIMELKRYKVLTLGEIPPAAGDAVNKIKVNGNPWGITQEDRFKWADGLDIPVIETGKKVDYLYYVGCAGSYDSGNQEVVKDVVSLLRKANVEFAVMGKTEKCNGDPIRRFGDEYSFFEVAIENIANMNQYQFNKVITHCPHCLHTIGKEYAKFEDGDFEVVHHTELLAELVKAGKFTFKENSDQKYTFHDPCYLGRHHDEYNAPRDILKSIPGLDLVEMKLNKDRSLCCGMGGGNMWYELPEGKDLSANRLGHVEETKSDKLATACSYCLINFNSSKSQNKATEELEIEDVATILHKSVK